MDKPYLNSWTSTYDCADWLVVCLSRATIQVDGQDPANEVWRACGAALTLTLLIRISGSKCEPTEESIIILCSRVIYIFSPRIN